MRVVRRVRDGILLVIIKRRLTTGTMPLHVYMDGTYTCPWFDARNTKDRRNPRWLTLNT